MIEEDAPVNNIGSGAIKGAGAVSPKAAEEYKKKNRMGFKEFMKRDR